VAPALLVIGVAGFFGVVRVVRVSITLDRATTEPHPGPAFHGWRGWPYALFVTFPYVAITGAAVLLWIGHADALGWLAITEGWLLVSGTVVAWILLSHAGYAAAAAASEAPPS
jgi:hypothetical protein